MAIKKLTGKQLKSFRSGVAALKAKGLVRKSTDARSQPPTRYMVNLVNNVFKDVLVGKASVVKTPSHKTAEKFKAAGMRTRGSRVVVPLETGAKPPKYRPKSGEIVGSYDAFGRHFERHYEPFSKDLGAVPPGLRVRYSIPLGNSLRFHGNSAQTFESFSELENFMFEYEHPPEGSTHHAYKNWRQFVIMDYVPVDSDDDDLDEGDF